jgi:hypothetical protein
VGGIFLIQKSGDLLEMREQPYDSEDLLQRLLAKYPSLLAGDQVDSASPRRWLLVSREMPIAGEEAGTNRWSLDHLFLDQDGIPTLVEVKRSTDTRIRREVVGQMLDYAANAVAYWPVDAIRNRFEALCQTQDRDPSLAVREFIEPETEPEDFWAHVKEHLQAGRVRLVFVADVIPLELQRVVEFLNRQMDPAEVLALEVRQFVAPGDGALRTLVPRVIGRTAEAQQRKRGTTRETFAWNETAFLDALKRRPVPAEAEVAQRIIDWAKEHMTRLTWGHGKQYGSCIPVFQPHDVPFWFFAIWTNGPVEIQFQYLQYKPPFDDPEVRRAFADHINAIPGVAVPLDAISRRPAFPLSALRETSSLNAFFAAITWAMDTASQAATVASGDATPG